MEKNIFLVLLALLFSSCQPMNEPADLKPVIYLYPEKEIEVTVELDYDGDLTCTYPKYDDGWTVTAYPDGKVINHADQDEYSYLFWEGVSDKEWEIEKGFVVSGEDTEKFLKEKLSYMGLLPKEYNEFIVFWLPKMQDNPYNLIYFAEEEYEDYAQLTITPEPDAILRVFMVFKPLNKPIDIEEQELKTFDRNGFVVVEWGGTQID